MHPDALRSTQTTFQQPPAIIVGDAAELALCREDPRARTANQRRMAKQNRNNNPAFSQESDRPITRVAPATHRKPGIPLGTQTGSTSTRVLVVVGLRAGLRNARFVVDAAMSASLRDETASSACMVASRFITSLQKHLTKRLEF